MRLWGIIFVVANSDSVNWEIVKLINDIYGFPGVVMLNFTKFFLIIPWPWFDFLYQISVPNSSL